jgi:uncharacterized protein (TIGR00106 family)
MDCESISRRIRIALGARAGEVARMMMAEGLRPAIVGVGVGVGGVYLVPRVLRSLLFRVEPLVAGIRPGSAVGAKMSFMKVIADLCVVPIGVGVSVSSYIAACERVLAEAGLKIHLHAYGTNVEGEWDEVFAAIKRCHEVVHEMGAPRIHTSIKCGTRIDRDQSMAEKVTSVRRKLE